MRFTRGSVVTANIGYGPHHYVVVSGDARNAMLPSFLGVRITTKPKPALDSIVELSAEDRPLIGRVLCDNIIELNHNECRLKGRLLQPTLRRIDDGLLAALGIDDVYSRIRGT